jgi:hypothetical protein
MVFQQEHLDIIQSALSGGIPVEVTKEQKGKYWNITDVKFPNAPVKSQNQQESPAKVEKVESPAPQNNPLKNAVENSRNRPFAVSYAKDVLVAKIQAGLVKEITQVEVDKTIHLAKEFLKFMDNNYMVEVAKTLGAVEVEDLPF